MERNIRNRLVFYAFFISIATAASIVGYVYFSNSSSYTEPDESTIRHITAQQQAFGQWYNIYKKKTDTMDYYWVLYHKTMKDFRTGKISLNEAYLQFSQLESDAVALHNEIFQLAPPISLDDDNYNLTIALMEKTKAYSAAQLQTIRTAKMTADPEKMPDISHDEQVRYLNDTMLLNAPDMLFTANEITALRENLTIPEVN
ncbi:MAG: hypothetical protein K6C05_07840 [Anaerovibrio sp.]|nr:hypothetical protein [Anaerovibrio sp.]